MRYGIVADSISIHALREEGDREALEKGGFSYHFYPRPPRGGRLGAIVNLAKAPIFLSTPSARRATGICRPGEGREEDFYPRPPRGGRPGTAIIPADKTDISIHALREEGDNCSSLAAAMTGRISIHALREEGDQNLT